MPFEAQSRSHRACCLRFAGRVASPPRKTRYRRVVTFAGQDLHLLAHHGRFPEIATSFPSPFPRLCLAQAGWAWAVARPGLPRIRTCALTHPARRVHRFAARSYPPQLRQDRVSDRCPIGLSLQRVRAPVPLFPPRGPSAVPPLSRYFRGTPTPHGPSRFASLPSLSGTAMVSLCSLPREVGTPDARGPGPLIAGGPSSRLPRRTWGLPGSWVNPLRACHRSLDPGGISAQDHYSASMLPPH